MLKHFMPLFFVLFVLTSCSHKSVQNQQSVLMTMKTQSIKFADMGFLYLGANQVKLEVYSNGQALLNLEIHDENICLSLLECMDKKEFNQKVLSSFYPNTLLENVLKAKPVFKGENLQKMTEGFEQKLFESGKYDISYSVLRDKRVFRDKINKILIKVKEVE